MPFKIWYEIKNTHDYPYIENLQWITTYNFTEHKDLIQKSIDSFNQSIEWDKMWNIEDAECRLKEGHDLFIGYDDQGPISHVWFQNEYLYNMFSNPRRPKNYSKRFIGGVLNYVPYDFISLCVDDWNKNAQKFWERVGSLV